MIVLILVAAVAAALYYYSTKSHDYWKKRGVKHDKPLPVVGNNALNFFMRRSMSQAIEEMYWKYPDEKIVGFFRGPYPELIIRDPDIAKQILTTDFSYFYPRGLISRQPIIEPMLRNLFFADGDLWRLLRQRMTPAFTSGKLKAMFPLIVERAERLQARALQLIAADKVLDARELMARYTTDFIGACGFGLDADSLQDENSVFRKIGAKIFKVSPKDFAKNVLKLLFPWTFRHVKGLARVEGDIMQIVAEVQRQRNYKPSGRNDFIDLLLECKAKGKIVGESIERVTADGEPEVATLEMDDELIAAQVFVFFAAGFETSSSATSTTLNELAHNPDVQARAQAEIDRVLAAHGGKLSYDAVKEMTYLEWTFKEGMRVFPSLGFLVRESARPYVIDGVAIDKGVKVFVPLQAMHNDPRFFAEPDQFRPERHDPQQFDPANKYVYMPFGVGPRACIGERLGLMQSLAGLAAVLARFTVRPAPGAPRRPAVDPASGIVQSVKGGVPLVFIERSAPPA
ncbi:cytochrome P450 6B6-like [Aricia agestis]|uniref:cytochrome P450 6B6-like n=1 Tax=Aricia agestis TaxID=91739 RepID=UPI001C20BACC|nr:cytochrome P450 6B6-like [Aricia agestis]